MASDGFGTLTGGFLERGTSRVRSVLEANGTDAPVMAGDRPTMPRPPEEFYSARKPAAREEYLASPARPAMREQEAFGTRAPASHKLGDLVGNSDAANIPDAPAPDTPVPDAPVPDAQVAHRAQPQLRQAPVPAMTKAHQSAPPPAKPAAAARNGKPPTVESRRGTSGNLMIVEPPSGDMSRITISALDAKPEGQANGLIGKQPQKPTSITYERRTITELAAEAAAIAGGAKTKPIWIETPNYSGPDRRHLQVSPDVERRQSVPPRIKAAVRLEQERFLRLKLAAKESGRSQQDLITSAIDAYFDTLSLDRFVRVAMEFGLPPGGRDSEGQKVDLETETIY